MSGNEGVIHWQDALQQVGDDEEFLRELLADLRSETELQLQTIAAILAVRCSCIIYFIIYIYIYTYITI